MSDNTDFDAAFAEATDTTVDTPDPTPSEPDGGEPAAAPDATATTEQATADESKPDGTEQPTTVEQTPDAAAAAAELAAVDKGTAPATPPAAKQEPATPAAAQQQLDPKFLAQAIAEAQELSEKKKPAPAPEPAKPLTDDNFLTDDDRKAIATFKEEWPTEFVAVDKMFNARLQAELGNYKTQLLTELNGVLAPVFQSLGTVQATSHMGSIIAVHPDAEAIAPAVAEWVKTQPSYAQPGMMAVLEKGTAAQINELLTDYKKTLDTPGAAPDTPAPVAEKPSIPPKKGPDTAAVAALAAVPAAQRPQPAARPSDDDFDAAFDEALKQA